MKTKIFTLAAITVLSFAVPAFGGNCNHCGKTSSCPCFKNVDVYQFQDSSDAIAGVHTKLWPMQPMKRWGPAKKERFMGFQKIADSIKGHPAAAEENCPASEKDKQSDPSGANVPPVAK